MAESFINKLEPFLKNIKPIEVKPTNAEARYKKDGDIKAVIFDIYGTLIISASGDIMQDSYDANMFFEALANSEFEIRVEKQKLMQIHYIFGKEVAKAKKVAIKNGTPFPELNIVEIWKKTLLISEKEGLISFTPNSNIKLYTFIFELSSNQVWPMPEFRETIKRLKSKGYLLGIVSNAQFYTPIMMNYFLYGKLKDDEFIDGFEKDISVFSYKILKGKPDVAIYKELESPLKKRGIKPQEVLYIGNDMLKDIYTAAQLSFKTCFFAGDMRAYRLRKDHPKASTAKPDYTITELKQLLEIL